MVRNLKDRFRYGGVCIRYCALLILSVLLIYDSVNAGEALTGVTFSQVQCEYLGMDWKDVYLKTLEIDPGIIRLGAYWSRIEKEQGKYDFSELDWQIQKAKARNIKIVLTVGMKAPRWPEFFIPSWVKSNVKFGKDVTDREEIKGHTLKFIEETVSRYSDEPAIEYWQVENEPLNRAGPKEWWIGKDFLKEEIALVKKVDHGKRPVIVNVATYPNKFLRFLSRIAYSRDPLQEAIQAADIVGINVYPAVGHTIGELKMCFWSTSKERKSYFTKIINNVRGNGKEIWITELQAEPWEPGQLVHQGEKSRTCWPQGFALSFFELRSYGIDKIFLWGAEYWFFRIERYNDHAWLDAALDLIGKQPDPDFNAQQSP